LHQQVQRKLNILLLLVAEVVVATVEEEGEELAGSLPVQG
jgi:hypothetical protein